MKAFILKQYGKKESLSSADVPMPQLRGDDVLIEVHAAAVNVIDVKIRNGEFKLILPYKTPITLGHDVAGVVVGVGSLVSSFKVGDEVYARPDDMRIGTFAEYIAVKDTSVAIKPKNISMEEAASIPLVGLTAWQALVEKAKVKKGQKIFIQAGSGGVGTFSIQLAKHLGATVATTTGTGNVSMVKDLGADVVIDYKKEAFEERLSGYDLVLNSQDGKTLSKSLGVLKPGGSLITITGPADPQFAEDSKAPWLVKQIIAALSYGVRRQARRLKVNFSFLFMKPSGSQLKQITRLIESGAIRPVVDKVFPFSATNDAMVYVESGRAKGKVVIKVK